MQISKSQRRIVLLLRFTFPQDNRSRSEVDGPAIVETGNFERR
jgi:hypothetical protein